MPENTDAARPDYGPARPPAPAGEPSAMDVRAAVGACGLALGDLVEYDGRIVDAEEDSRFVPGGRGRIRDVWAAGGEVVARVEREGGASDAPALKDLRPATTTVSKASGELRAGDIVRVHGMRVRLDAPNPPHSTDTDDDVLHSWTGTVLNLADVHAAGHVPRSHLRRWSGLTLLREDAWTVQGADAVRRDVEVPLKAPELSAPLVAALRAKGLEPSARQGGVVTVTAHGIDWKLEPVPHAVTGEWCGVWSAVGPKGSRGMFVAANAASFIADRRVP
ncbi:hypothetical protein ACFYMW_35725 [Streptomyces sp. NPDC006692]|uniref:hypothetical protein n=1 Tax=unclassified Streptomyces TaxID=2593676 RepID=UPI0034143FE6